LSDDQRIPSLDGCRAIAISLVVFWHLSFSTRDFPRGGFDWGDLGVFIFFVISGFLITTVLQREQEQRKSISLGNFYIRRVFRIFPALLFFLLGVELLTKLGLASVPGRALLFSLSFLRNYYPGPYRILHHLWSLSVEEQFYLVWPFLFAYLSKRTACRLLTGIIILAPILRLGTLFWLGQAQVWNTEEVADGLACGCLLAIQQKELRASRVYQWLSRPYVSLVIPCLIVGGAYTHPRALYEGLGKSVIFLGVALGIDMVILRHESPAGKLLNSRPLVWLGKLSYSLYLWQQVFLIVKREDQPYAWFPVNLGLAFLCAVVSYYLIERPSIQFGRRIVARKEDSARMMVPVASESEMS
jgi:peptidoglycan/LPS O-acetylase OafA/YrhL